MSALQDHPGDEPETIEIDTPQIDQETARQLTVARVTNDPVSIFADPTSLAVVYASIEAEIAAFVPDLSTPTSRKKITALSAKFTKMKTGIDAAGKELNSELRARIGKVDEIRRGVRDSLDHYADLARQPLTDWEKAEEMAKARIASELNELQDAGLIFNDDTVEELEARLSKLHAMEINAETFRDFATEAEGRRKRAVEAIENGIQRIRDEERRAAEQAAQQEELAQLRREKEERDRRDAEREEADRVRQAEEARLAREKSDREAAERAEAERAARETEQRERDRIEAEERMKAAAEAAERRAREEAAAEQARREREIEERHAAELRAIEEAAAQKERDRLAEEKRQRDAAEAEKQRQDEATRKEREAEERRQLDKKHRAKVKGEVVASILATIKDGLFTVNEREDDMVRTLVEAIADGRIAHTAIKF